MDFEKAVDISLALRLKGNVNNLKGIKGERLVIQRELLRKYGIWISVEPLGVEDHGHITGFSMSEWYWRALSSDGVYVTCNGNFFSTPEKALDDGILRVYEVMAAEGKVPGWDNREE